MTVAKELEPSWEVVSYNGVEPSLIKANDRGKLNVFAVSDYTDRHFSLNKGNPLYNLYMQLKGDAIQDTDNAVLDVVRAARVAFDDKIGDQFDAVINKVKEAAEKLGITLNEMKAMLDHRDIAINENKVSIHEDGIPFRLKGKGSKRLLSLAIQLSLTQPSGVILIDEVEQGLEPDRVQHLVNVLSQYTDKQIIITTHSSNVIVEIPCTSLFIMRQGRDSLLHVEEPLQGSIRKNPEAFFARKVLVCEGATEVGICRAINKHRIDAGITSAACLGVRFADGGGNNQTDYAEGFNALSFPTMMFCDSDETIVNNKKQSIRDRGIRVVDCQDGYAIEEQVFHDLPSAAIKEMVSIAIQKVLDENPSKSSEEVERSLFESTNSRMRNKMASMNQWCDNVTDDLRQALGGSAKKNEWYKRQDYGEKMGECILKHYAQLNAASRLKKEIDEVSSWIDA